MRKRKMRDNNNKILLNDILRLKDLDNVRLRFNLMFRGNWNPVEFFRKGDLKILLEGHYWNYSKRKSFKEGQVTVGFIRLPDEDLWLLFHIGKITRDLNVFNGPGYEYETLNEYEKFFGRLIIRYHNTNQNMIRKAVSVIDQCVVEQILPEPYDQFEFPGYDKVNLSWDELTKVIDTHSWKTALQNQKGVYLLTDGSNGKMYVGAAYGEEMIWGRWKKYLENGHGGNKKLKELGKKYLKKHLKFSILEVFNYKVDDKQILLRENWWKDVLQTRKFGYNEN
jgi:hypothetical protein